MFTNLYVFRHCRSSSRAGILVRTHNLDYENADVPNNVERFTYLLRFPDIRIQNRHYAGSIQSDYRNFNVAIYW
jgi:hypothetical protein